MNPEAGLLQAIVADPEDDTPRLVYADWLEDHGEADRAGFIHLQIELARQPLGSPRRRELAFHVREVLDRHGEQWVAAWRAPRDIWLHTWQFSRGFIEKAEVMGEDLDNCADELFASLPLGRFQVTDLSGEIEPLARIPSDNRLTGLDLCGNGLDADSLEDLADLSNLAGLRVLGLMFNHLDDDAAGLLCERPFFERLSLIRCAGNPFTQPAAQRLRDHFGPRISFEAERDEDHLYAIQDERFTAGFGADYTQVLLYGSDTDLRVALFDHEGNLLRTEYRAVPQVERPAGPWQELPMETREAWMRERDNRRAQVREAWLKELGWRSATIQVKRFQFEDGAGLFGFPRGWTDVLSTPNGQRLLDHWLAAGKCAYVFASWNDWWLNRAGEVTDT